MTCRNLNILETMSKLKTLGPYHMSFLLNFETIEIESIEYCGSLFTFFKTFPIYSPNRPIKINWTPAKNDLKEKYVNQNIYCKK